MSVSVGIGLAFVAMLSWGVADFLIQRSVRKVGDMTTLFFVSSFGALVLFLFVKGSFFEIFLDFKTAVVILGAGVVIFIAAVLDFEALRVGKLSIVEPIFSLETISSVTLAAFILHERPNTVQAIFITILLAGLILVAMKHKRHYASLLERGAFIALITAIMMGCANFLIGWGSRLSDPLIVNFVTDTLVAIFCAVYILWMKRGSHTLADSKSNFSLLLMMSITDISAWVAFSYSMVLVPIGIAVALSESYIIVAVLLGLLINREKLHKHQKVGLVLALVAAVALASTTA